MSVLCENRRDLSLQVHLVRSNCESRPFSTSDCGAYLCGRPLCRTCTHTNTSSSIHTPYGHLNISHRYTCTTSNLVYLIQCRVCTKCYIGETGRRRSDRFREHLRSTSANTTCLLDVIYFSSPGHSSNEMLVLLILTVFRNATERKQTLILQ